jgi:precorrin-4/cobalt-precorrin-4 C11-methyltransferase
MTNDIKVHFVGAGPGAKDLITVRGMNLLKNCDMVIYAGSLVNPEILEYAGNAEILNSAYMTLEEVIEAIKRAVDEGKDVVRLHTGDQSIYGAVREQMDILEEKVIAYESCPGVSACFGAAAAMNLEYTLPGKTQTLIITRMEGKTAVPESEKIRLLAGHQASMAVYLSAAMLEDLSRELILGGYPPDTPAALIYKATWPEEKRFSCTVASLAETGRSNGISRTAVVLVGDAVLHRDGYERSKLYDPEYETGYRKK